MIVASRFFSAREKVSNNPDPSLHKTCKLFASQRIIEFILGGPPSIIYPLAGSAPCYAGKLLTVRASSRVASRPNKRADLKL